MVSGSWGMQRSMPWTATCLPGAGRAGHSFRASTRAPTGQRRSLQVTCALSRQAKEETLERLVPLLQQSALVLGLRYKGLTVKQLEKFRSSLPETTKLVVCKNTLVSVATDRVPGWEALRPAAKGDNAWFFVPENDIRQAIQCYVEFDKEVKEGLPVLLDKPNAPRPMDVSGGVLETVAVDSGMLKRLETMPTRKELMAKIALLLRAVPQRLARTLKAVPERVARSVRAVADADEDKAKLVADLVQPKPAPTEP